MGKEKEKKEIIKGKRATKEKRSISLVLTDTSLEQNPV